MAEATAQPNVMDKLGMKVQGLVSEVSSYADKKSGQFKYSVHLFMPGNAILKVGLKETTDPTQYQNKIGQTIGITLKSREYQGNLFFTEA